MNAYIKYPYFICWRHIFLGSLAFHRGHIKWLKQPIPGLENLFFTNCLVPTDWKLSVITTLLVLLSRDFCFPAGAPALHQPPRHNNCCFARGDTLSEPLSQNKVTPEDPSKRSLFRVHSCGSHFFQPNLFFHSHSAPPPLPPLLPVLCFSRNCPLERPPFLQRRRPCR